MENDDQKEVLELKQERDEREAEKFLEGQEFHGAGEKFLEESGHEAPDNANDCSGEVGGEPGVSGNKVVGDEDVEELPCFSPYRARFVRKFSKPAARQTRHDPFSSTYYSDFDKSSGDYDDEYSDYPDNEGLHMHALSSRPPPPPVGAGLANMGNTCFLNAVMQCFTHTVPLVLGLKLYDCGFPSHHNDGEFCALSAVRDHVSYALAAPGDVIYPDNLVNNLSNISSFFQRFHQEDAHEYLQCLLDKTDTCWSKCKVDGNGFSTQGDNLVKQVFGGRLVSQLHCCKCGSRSDTYEPLVDLSLEIEDADDLNGALKSFTKMEENEDEVKFTCEKCKEQVPLKKQLLIDQTPCVATLHLKRFKGDSYFVEKIDKALRYPLELDMKPYTIFAEDENVDLKYELYGIIVHIGFSSTSGHYLCYIRSSPGRWFRIDDSKVTEVKEEVALSQQGYILFYAKKGTPWPCSLVKSSSCDNGILSTSPKSVLDALEYTQHSDPRKACFYNQNALEGTIITEMEATELKLPFLQAEICRNADEVTATELPTVMEMEASKEPKVPFQQVFDDTYTDELKATGNSLYSGVLKDEAKIVGSEDALNPMLTSNLSKKSTEDIVVHKTKSSGMNGNATFSQPVNSRPPSSRIHPESEYGLHSEAPVNPRTAKKVKVEKSASPVKPIKSGTPHDNRKRSEAIKSLRGLPSARRSMLMNAICDSGKEASTSKKRRWLR